MVEHKLAYGLCGESVSDIAGLKAKGIIDFDQVVRPGVEPDPNFVSRCNAAGVSPNFNNGNDGVSGCGGKDCNSYYARIAAAGYHSAGGESEPNAEWHAIMNNLIGRNYGGDWGQCPGGFSDIFSHQLSGENVIGHGMSSVLETYTTSVQLCTAGVVSACVNAAKHGCKEVGLMIGDWMPVTAQPYIDMVRQIEAQGVKVGCIVVWAGYGSSMDAVYNKWQSVFNQLMAIWPPDMRTLKARFTPGAPTASTITASAASVVINGPVVFNTQLKDGKSMAVLANKPITIYHTFNGVRYDDITINTDANGAAKLTQQFASAGVRMYHAEFKGDSTYAASTSPLLSITVTSTPPVPIAQTVMTLTAMDTHPLVNVPVVFTATLTTADGKPVAGKNITVKHSYCNATYNDATLTTNANGQATLTQKFTSHCVRSYTATFIGDAGYGASGAKVDIYATQPP